MKSSRAQVEKAPTVSIAHAKPPFEAGSLSAESEVGSAGLQTSNINITLLESLRASNKVLFESTAAVIPGQSQSERNIFQKTFSRLFNERSYVSFGEVKRYIVIVEGNCYVFADATDPSPLYTIQLNNNLQPVREDSKSPHFRSTTVSPEANTGIPRANLSKGTLVTVLLIDAKDKIAFQLTFDTLVSGEDVDDRFVSAFESSQSNVNVLKS